MPVNGAGDRAFETLYAEAAAWVGEDLDVFDVHTHIGHNDPDGFEADPEELVAALDDAGHAGGLVFAMHEPAGYGPANDAALAMVERWPDRFAALARVDPKAPGAIDEARRCLEAGARGIKLHPRSEAFALTHPAVGELAALVAEHRGVLLFHAGRGIPMLGERAVVLAESHPGARIVLAHAGISDLGVIAPHAERLDNLLFDTAWWQVGDVLQLLTTIPPARIVYASDMPYGPPAMAATTLIRCARETGLAPAVVREMLGPQGRRAVAGEPLRDLGPAPGAAALGARLVAFERVVAYSTAAVQMAFRGADPSEALALARLACQAPDPDAPHGAALAVVDAYLERAQDERAAQPDGELAGVQAMVAAHVVAGTPGALAPLPPV